MKSVSNEDQVAWVAELTGREYDLEDLAHWTNEDAISVLGASLNDLPYKYHLHMQISLVGMNHTGVRQRAEQVMVALNAGS